MVQGISSTLSALQVLEKKIGMAAHDVANVNTQGFKKSPPTGQEPSPLYTAPRETGTAEPQSSDGSDVDLAEEMALVTVFQRNYEANLKVLETENEMKGDVLNIIS